MAELINDLSGVADALNFQRVLSSQISIRNNLGQSESQDERIELELVPKVGRSEHGRIVFVIEIRANTPSLNLDIDVRAIYAHEQALQFADAVLWQFFAYSALPALVASLMRIRDAIIPLMFAQLDFLEPLDDLRGQLLARAVAASD